MVRSAANQLNALTKLALKDATVQLASATSGLVITTFGDYAVDLENRTCSCINFQDQLFPCVHSLALLMALKKSPYDYIASFYFLEEYKKTYGTPLEPISLHHLPNNPIYSAPSKGCSNLDVEIMGPGRPETERKESSGGTKRKTCSLCGTLGHTKKTCGKQKKQKQISGKQKKKKRENPIKTPIRTSGKLTNLNQKEDLTAEFLAAQSCFTNDDLISDENFIMAFHRNFGYDDALYKEKVTGMLNLHLFIKFMEFLAKKYPILLQYLEHLK